MPNLGVSVTEQADNLNDHFSDVCCQLPLLSLKSLPSYLPAPPLPTIHVWEVQNCFSKLNASKAGHPEDIPVKIIKEFSFEMAEPLTKIFNASLQEGDIHLFGKLRLWRRYKTTRYYKATTALKHIHAGGEPALYADTGVSQSQLI